jgi:hypothetical protein
MRTLVFLLFSAVVALPQSLYLRAPQAVTVALVDPTGTCLVPGMVTWNAASNKLFGCPSVGGTWTVIGTSGSGGSGITPTGGINYIPYVTSGSTARATTQADLTGLIGSFYALPSAIPTWTTLSGKPTFAPVATSGLYSDLASKPTLFDGAWASLSGKPTWTASFDGTYQTLGGTPPTGGSGISPTGGTNYIPFVTTGTTSRAVTQSDLTAIIGGYYSTSSGATSITCGGTNDTAVVLAAAPLIQLPANTCAVDALNLPANSILKGPGTVKWISGSTGNAITESNANVVFDNFTLDLNGNLPAGASGGFFINGGNNFTIRNVRVISTGAPAGMLNPAISVYNAGGLIQNVTVNNTVKGEHLFVNPNKRSDLKLLVDGWVSDGSNQNDIAIQNSGSEGPANVEIAHFSISNVTDTNGGTGQVGNAIDTFWADGVLVHDGVVSNTRFSIVRFATSQGNHAYNIKSTGNQETAYYAELGSSTDTFHDLTIENGVSGINLTNVSQRPNYPNDSPNTAYSITCRNLIDYCIQTEHDIVHDVLVDGVPIGIHQANGNTTGNNVVRNVTCTRSSTAFPNVDVCNALDVNIKSGAVDLVSGIATMNYTPLIANIFGSSLTSGNNITAITKANPAVVTFSTGSQPVVGSYYCFRQVGGMTQMNGLCTLVAASTSTTFTTQIDSTSFGTFAAPTGGQKSWTMQFYDSSGNPQYAIPSNFVQSTDGLSGVFGSAQPTHPTLSAGATAGNPYSVAVGTTTPYTTNPETTPAGTVATGLAGNGTTDDTAALQTALNANTVTILNAGTYKITSSLNIPSGHTLFGIGHPTIIGNNGAFALSYINSGATLKGVTFDGGSVLNYDNLNSATIMYNTFRNHTAALNGDVAQNNLLHIGQLTNSTIKYNTFYNDMPPSSVDIDVNNSGSDPDYGSGNPKTCLWIQSYVTNSSIDYNTFDLCQEGLKFASGDTTLRAGLHVGNNKMTRIHRIGIETQQYHTGAVIENNVIKAWNLSYYESYAISWATPQSVGTVMRGNFLQNPIADPGCSASLTCGLGIEFGSQNGQVYNNTIMGPWLTGSIQIFGGSTGNEVTGNRACTYNTNSDRLVVSVGQDEHSGSPTGTNIHDNTVISGISNGCGTINWTAYDLSL